MSEVSRERVQRMLAFQPVDQVPLEYHPCWRGLYEYGERFRDLVRSLPGDFEDFSNYPTPVLTPDLLDEHGEYHEFRTDEWGVQWEYRIFQMSGHPPQRSLGGPDELSRLPYAPAEVSDAPGLCGTARPCKNRAEVRILQNGVLWDI